MPKLKSEDVGMLPGTFPVYDITCKDVVMGRGSGTQNHCGNVTYRKLVFLNKVRSENFVLLIKIRCVYL